MAKDLLNFYTTDSYIQTLATKLREPNKKLYLKLPSASLAATIAAATYKINKQHNLIVAETTTQAHHIYTDLCQILQESNLALYPPYKTNKDTDPHKALCNQTLLKLSNNQPICIVTSPEAALQKHQNPHNQQLHTIKKGHTLNPQTIINKLQNSNFKKVPFAKQFGQFAIRGGIIDIFSYSSHQPYRVELSGNQVENIRHFDPESQLSDQTLESCIILGNVDMPSSQNENIFSYLPPKSTIWLQNYTKILNTEEEKKLETLTRVIQE